MSSPISSTPLEILRLILSNVDLHSLPQCRLVHSTWAVICNEYYLPEVRINDITGFAKLVAISKHPVVSSHVESVICTKFLCRRGSTKR